MPSKVFVSYSHDSPDHKKRVRDFVLKLRGHDVAVVYDEDAAHTGGPDEGWPRWCERQIVECDYVLACCTQLFHSRFEGKLERGAGHGVAWEAQMIRQYLYDHPRKNRKIRVLVLDEPDRAYIPGALRPYHVFAPHIEDSYAELLGWLRITLQTPVEREASAVAWPAPSLDFTPSLAGRSEELEQFRNMLAGKDKRRVLLVQGPSNSGKSVLIDEWIAYAAQTRIAFGKADFKGGLLLERVFETLLLDLGEGALPKAAAAKGLDRTLPLIADLQEKQAPLLLTFDTYQDAPQQGRDWVESLLLSRIDRCPAVVIVVAGHTVPEQTGRSWGSFAQTISLPPIYKVEDWLDYARRSYDGVPLTREHVEAVTLGNSGNPGRVSAMLGALARALPMPQPADGGG